jgi:uncharacterized protein (TIGR02001 family)
MQANLTRFAKCVAIASLAAFSGVLQATELSGNLGVTNNYIFRGITQTDDQAAVQGGLDLTTDFYGFHVGTWVSNVNFSGDKGYEVDLYGGFAGNFWDIDYDLGLIYYAYPTQDDLDVTELFATGSYTWSEGLDFNTGAYMTVTSDNASFNDGGSVYVPLGLDIDLPIFSGVGFSPFGGYWVISNGQDYGHWGAKLSKDAEKWGEFSVAYEQNSFDGAGVRDPRVVLYWTKEFGF